MLNYFTNQIKATIYVKNKKPLKYEYICFSSFADKSSSAYKAHYKLNNSLKENEKLIRDYLTLWNNWKETKNWFNIDKIIADNGLVWNFTQELHKVNTKQCILRLIDEHPDTVKNIVKLNEKHGFPIFECLRILYPFAGGHFFYKYWKPNLKFTSSKLAYKKKRSQTGIWDAWGSSYYDKDPVQNQKDLEILRGLNHV